MTATNHALTGAVIGLTIGNPYIAVPLAFMSHYLQDAIPHSGSESGDSKYFRSQTFLKILLFDVLLCVSLVTALFINHQTNWFLASICAFAATSPDIMWVPDFVAALKSKPLPKHKNFLVVLHAKVQWYQKPLGGIVEAAWFAGGIFVVYSLLR